MPTSLALPISRCRRVPRRCETRTAPLIASTRQTFPSTQLCCTRRRGQQKRRAKGTQATMAGKRAKAQKVSDATLGKFDADKSMDAYLDMQKSAEELRNKHRVGQGIF